MDTFGHLFQGLRWVAESAYVARPFRDTTALRTAFQDALFTAGPEQQQDLVAAYPTLGCGPAGRG